MDDYESLRALLPSLKRDAAEWRQKQAEAGSRAMSLERAAKSIQELLGPDESPGTPFPDLEPQRQNGRLLGVAAVRALLREDPDRVWGASEIHKQLEARGWLNEEAKHPQKGTEAAVNRLWRGGEVQRVDRGRYRLSQKEHQDDDG
jgi:hypothetical protein